MFPVDRNKFILSWRFDSMCVQSVAPITSGKPALGANCALMLTCSAALCGDVMYLDDSDDPVPHSWLGSAQG